MGRLMRGADIDLSTGEGYHDMWEGCVNNGVIAFATRFTDAPIDDMTLGTEFTSETLEGARERASAISGALEAGEDAAPLLAAFLRDYAGVEARYDAEKDAEDLRRLAGAVGTLLKDGAARAASKERGDSLESLPALSD